MSTLLDNTKKIDGHSKQAIKRNSARTVFLGRVLALSAQSTSQGGNLSPYVQTQYEDLLKALRKFEHNMQDYKDPTMKWLDKAIDRTHAFGIANLIETFSQIETEQDELLYQQVCALFHEIVSVRKRGKKVDFNKYRLLFQVMEEELTADSTTGKGRLSVHENSLVFTFNPFSNDSRRA